MDIPYPQVITVPDVSLFEAIQPHAGNLRLILWEDGTDLPDEVKKQVTGVILPYMHESRTLNSLHELPCLTWVQTQSTGFDNVLACLPEGVMLSNAAGVHASSTAELAVGLTIASLRHIDTAARDMLQGIWREKRHRSLVHRNVLVLGAGNIGDAIVRRLLPFEVTVSRFSRTPRRDTLGEVIAIDRLGGFLGTAEIIIVALPLTGQTTGLIDSAFLAQLPDGALIVNVGRGAVIRTDDLAAELNSGRLHAALDVVDPEPLPADHPLWKSPNLLITPHLGGNTSAFVPGIQRLLAAQLSRLNGGEMPEYRVN